MREATKLVEAGKIKIMLDATRYSMATVGAAYQAIIDRSAEGKLAVDIG